MNKKSGLKNLFIFYKALILPWMKFKLQNFSIKKISSFFSVSSFRKSIARHSHELSLITKIWLSTIEKTKNKKLIINFIKNLLLSPNWFSFTDLDILNSENWNLYFIRNSIKKLIAEFNNDTPPKVNIYITTKIFNRIIKNFVKTCYLNNNAKFSFFWKKYFSSEKYIRAYGLSNNLHYMLVKFFSFYTNNLSLLKNIFLKNIFFYLPKQFNKLFNYDSIFLGKRYYIFFDKQNFKNFNLLINNFFKNINLNEFIIFFDGKIFFKSNQKQFFNSAITDFFESKDLSFINFFFKTNKKYFAISYLQNFNMKMENIKINKFLDLFTTFLYLNISKLKFYLFRYFQFILKIIFFKFFFLEKTIFKFFFLKLCLPLVN